MQKLYNYTIGQIVDDMKIVDFIYNKHHQKVAICDCVVCNRPKKMIVSCLSSHKGTTHKACGQYLKTKDRKFYYTWQAMKSRIYNESYCHYDRCGGRGLSCDYNSFVDFYDDMYDSYINALKVLGDKISIDRIDNDIGYIKGNLRWTTQEHQVRNSTKVKEFYAVSPNKEYYKSNNQRQFAINHGLNDKQIGAVLHGRFKTTLGWKFTFEPFDNVDNYIDELYY